MYAFSTRTALLMLLFALPPIAYAAAPARAWTVRDSVAVRYFVSDPIIPGFVHPPTPEDELARFSPDGRHFFFQSFHGVVEADQTNFELWIFSSADVRRALSAGKSLQGVLRPVRSLVMRSGFPGAFTAAAIYLPQWESNSTITFIGTEGVASRRVYRYDIVSGSLTPLTDASIVLPESGGRTFAARGSTVVFKVNERSPRDTLKRYPYSIVDSTSLSEWYDATERDHAVYYVSREAGPGRVLAKATIGFGLYGPWMSPDGKWAVAVYPPQDSAQPEKWTEYTFSLRRGVRFALFDLEAASSDFVLDAPAGPTAHFYIGADQGVAGGTPYAAFWSADSRHVLLMNTALPLDVVADERRKTGYIVDYDVMARRWNLLDAFPYEGKLIVESALWLEEGKRLAVTYRAEGGTQPSGRLYTYDGTAWRGTGLSPRNVPRRSATPPDFTVRLRESVNDPPRVVATNGRRDVPLTDADPALEGIWRAPVEAIYWKDSRDTEVESLLMLPRDYSAAKRVPLVIQLSDPFNPADAFRPDGEVGTAFAAQALAAQGLAVLQVEPAGAARNTIERDSSIYFSPNEGSAQVRRVDDAVEMLRQRGIVGDSPIGLIGFSRSGYYVYYVVTHPGRTRVGAAAAFDSITYGYGDYVNLAALNGPGFTDHYGWQYGPGGAEQRHGASGFWQAKRAWLDAPAFNLDRLKTPVLFHITGEPLAAIETVGAMQLARRPFDYYHYPGAPHQLQAPRQREAAMQSTVDWMNFWLQGIERADAADRFDRWRKIRANWQRTQAAEADSAASCPARARAGS